MSAVSRLEGEEWEGWEMEGMDAGAEAHAAERGWMLDIEAGRVSIYYHQPHFIRIKQQLKGLEDGGESQMLTDLEGGVTSQQDVTLGRRSGEQE